MPYHIESKGDEFEVVDDAGKVVGKHPTRKMATAQLRALYANVPEARKESGELTDDQLDALPIDEDWLNSILSDERFKEFSSEDQRKAVFAGLADSGSNGEGSHRLSHVSSVKKAIDEVKFQRAALNSGGYGGDKNGDKRTISRNYKRAVERLKKLVNDYESDGYSGGIGALKKAGLKEMDTKTDKATAEINNLPDSAFLFVESGGSKDNSGKTEPRSLRHLPYRKEGGAIDLPKLRNALSRLGQSATGESGGEKWLTAGKRDELRAKAEKILHDNTDAETVKPEKKEAKPDMLDRLIGFITGKEGRRNAAEDQNRLQQIHDLAVANGADCMFSVKEVNGQYRWVMLSSNSFQDTDKEIVSQKALEGDVARTDKETGGDFGPLRWWHMGDPDPVQRVPGQGVDIGRCDFRAMNGRTLIESGYINDKRIGLALKNKADDLAASIGFFHPLSEPDGEGVYHSIHVFERSVLPRAKASNQLTALTVRQGDHDMATMKEKWEQFVTMLGGDEEMAKSVVKQAQETEQKADEAGLKFKAKAEEKKDKKGEEGSPEEEKTEPEKEAAEEGDEETPKGFEKKFGKMVKKEIDLALAEQRKATTEKEASLEAQITALSAQLKEAQNVIATLAGDMPRGVRAGYRASIAPETVTNKEAPNQPKPDPLGDMYNWMTQSLGNHPG